MESDEQGNLLSSPPFFMGSCMESASPRIPPGSPLFFTAPACFHDEAGESCYYGGPNSPPTV